ncbi:hypothetical protein [Chamaesiphon minutus]|uniref:Uncharacterized protein n=1 Tax=Chamaesiphon minutus (strain ATCC 27169 / PCC 6605) TaxID=1173020 RepID=K9UK20_CHAP6|nr:hypothetical protein [Chamaesiphon minutus]AFY94549.1 hypothetical protein Cha6605_3560 [Chamaesiphon minutus PCC 6605]
MRNPRTNIRKIAQNILTKEPTKIGITSPSYERDVVAMAPHKTQPVKRLFLWEKLFASISVGLGIMMMGVGAIEYPGQSTALRQVTLTESIDRQPLQTIATTSDLPAKQNRITTAPGTKPDPIQIAQAALQEAKTALTLSRADVAQADINIQTFKKDYDRDRELYKQGKASSQQLAQAKSEYDFAQQQKRYALHGLKQVEQQVEAAEAALDTVRSQLRSSKICSRRSIRKSGA